MGRVSGLFALAVIVALFEALHRIGRRWSVAARRISLVAFLILLAAMAIAGLPLVRAQRGMSGDSVARALITHSVDESLLVTLRGNTRPEANAANDRGPVADDFPMEHLWLLLKRPPEREKALERFMEQQTDPKSPNYHRWLTARQLGQQYGPADEDIAKVSAWLESHGFTVNLVYPHGLVIDFSGTAGEVREAFHTEIHYLDVNGQKHFANMSDPRIPGALAPAVVGVVSLNNFMPKPMLQARPSYTQGGGTYSIVPADLATIYNLNPLFSAGYSGQGYTIVVIEDSDVYNYPGGSRLRHPDSWEGAVMGRVSSLLALAVIVALSAAFHRIGRRWSLTARRISLAVFLILIAVTTPGPIRTAPHAAGPILVNTLSHKSLVYAAEPRQR